MLHYMKLNPEPFEKIKSGKKTVELRLYDEKRRQLHIGDEICFTNLADKTETLLTEVVELFVFDSFEKLYKTIPLEMCGYSKEEALVADPHDMDAYYSAEEQKEYGVVGIELKMNNKLSKEEQERVLNERLFSSETFAEKTAQFNLNTRIYIFTPNKLLAVDEENRELEYFIKLHEVFRLSKEFKTDFWIDDLFEECADLHAVSQNGYLYISCDTHRDLECEFSSKITLEFANDICHAFEEYCGKKLICEIEPPNKCHSDETWLIIKATEN